MNHLHDRPSDEQIIWLEDHKPAPLGPDGAGAAHARAALVVHIDSAADRPPAPRTAGRRSPAKRGRWATRLLAAGALAAASGIVAANLPSRDHGIADAAVIKQIRAAAAAGDGISALTMIAYDHDADGDEVWSLFDRDGGSIQRHRISSEEPNLDGYVTTRLRGGRWQESGVTWNLANHTWTASKNSRPGPTANDRQTLGTTPTPPGLDSSAETILDALNRSEIKIVTRGTFEGEPAIRVRIACFEGYDRLLWVDAKTYQPKQLTEYRNGKMTSEQTWFPLTDQTRKLLTPNVPAGYERLSWEQFSYRVNHN